MSKQEEYESGERLADVRIWTWIFVFRLAETKVRVRAALTELKRGTAPCIDGMISRFSSFLESHS